MWLRFLSALLCLLSFGAEVLLDPSTPFVRSSPSASIGKLVVKSAASSSSGPAQGADPDAKDLSQFAADFLIARPAALQALHVVTVIYPLVSIEVPAHQPPQLAKALRPPIA